MLNPDGNPTRSLIGILAVAALAIAGLIHSYEVSADLSGRSPDPYRVAAGEQRFADAARRLPAMGVIGYLSDLPCEGCARDSTQAGSGPRRQGGDMSRGTALRNAGNAAFVAARYALAPRLVAPTPEAPSAEWALGNFSRPLDFAGFGQQFGFTMVADLGNGVVLYRRAKP
jgi:hypothetical protein